MFDDRELTESRISRFVQDSLAAKIYQERAEVQITAYRVPGEPIPPREAIAQQYEPIEVGARLGRAWSTTWLHVTGTVPSEWAQDDTSACELIVDLDFTGQPGFQAEALVFTPDGVPVKAINPYNRYLPVTPGEQLDYYLECAANPMVSGDWSFSPTPLGDPDTIPEEDLYRIKELRLARRDVQIWELAEDVRALRGLMVSLPEKSQRRHEILRALEAALDAADPDDMPGTARIAREVLRPVLESPAGASALTVLATGHAHIDSAWLWPVRETVRKVARTFSNVCTLIENDPDITFSASSAQQYKWLKDRYPELFARIKERVADGRFAPVGGMWVESDTNMPGSEAMARQFVAGKRFFLENFGVETRETWLPDSFGYSAALPQITALAGHEFFLTQKVSWNQVNTFPHHTFRWEGIDGTSVFTHFPPADTYNGMLSGEELAYFERNFKEKGRSSIGIDLFGWGDGGGGPTREMMAAGRRAADLEGSPKVEFGTSEQFFERAREEYPDAPVWNGELYLELHRGTFSAQPGTKQGNRRSEHLLHETEFLASLAAIRSGFKYPHEQLEELWEDALLNQFHDTLPGSSIAWVHRDAERSHAALAERAGEIIEQALAALGGSAGTGTEASEVDAGAGGVGAGVNAEQVLVNTTPVARRGVPAYGAGPVEAPQEAVVVIREGDTVTVENEHLRAVLDGTGSIVSLRDRATGREAIAPGERGALLQLHRDTPNAWDAWDIDEFYRHVVRDIDTPTGVEVSEDEGGVRVSYTYTTELPEDAESRGVTGAGSTIVKTFVLRPGDTSLEIVNDLDWTERKKALKLAFPLDVRAAHMSSEIQFGHVDRPVPVNTTWDFARFETCAHRWVHVAEGDYGVAIANDSTYGHDVLRTVREDDGGTTTTARLTLVRAPEYPDPGADHGHYTMRVSVRPGAGIREAVEEGYRINLPERQAPAAAAQAIAAPLVAVDAPNVLVETVKLAEDRSGDLVVRLYESEGARAAASVTLDGELDGGEVTVVDLLERPFGEDAPAFRSAHQRGEDGTVQLAFRPFEIKTLRISRASRRRADGAVHAEAAPLRRRSR
ncbi:glycosyl hydrolase-related protein [Brachybacterium muris]|uniref:alpha-mannosidase n=1 Tax=Brachybacterium muris TaxID=219301 RepID=UPI00223C04CF|nr:glycoside hydrolase family 38 C-terminal domain-containing protein [Brachybacterium muris]MCT2260272.1 glycosyl hydrolase-related protein [Brachybacterium muris]